MRLINADALLTNMDKGMQGTAREYLKFYQMAVNDEPTAYDVDKVVERLEKLIKTEYEKPENCNENKFVDGEGIYEDGRTQGKYEAYKTSLEIVKSVGIQYPNSSNTDTENVTADWKEHLAGRFNRFE